jgi:hypothetical protein
MIYYYNNNVKNAKKKTTINIIHDSISNLCMIISKNVCIFTLQGKVSGFLNKIITFWPILFHVFHVSNYHFVFMLS